MTVSFLRLVAVLLALLAPAIGAAQSSEAEGVLDEVRRELTAIQDRMRATQEDADLVEMRMAALDLQTRLQELRNRVEPDLAETEARIAELGPAPDDGAESPDIAAERQRLENERSALYDQARFAALLAVEVQQTAAQISTSRRVQFQARLGARTQPLLGTAVWRSLRADLNVDARRARAFLAELRTVLAGSSVIAWLAAFAAAGLFFWLRARSEELLLRTVSAIALDRLRRSLFALGRVLTWVVSAALTAYAIELAFRSGAPAASSAADVVSGVLFVGVFGVYVAALGTALISAKEPSWRLLALSDDVANALRRFPILLASLLVLRGAVEVIAAGINVTLTTAVTLTGLTTLALALALARGLRRAARQQAAALRRTRTREAPFGALPLWLIALVAAGWVLLIGGAVLVLVGYVALGSFIVNQVAWAAVVICTAFLLSITVDDALLGFFAAPQLAPAGGAAEGSSSARMRLAVLLSALVRVLIVLTALLLLLEPYGGVSAEFFRPMDGVLTGVSIGDIQLRPAAIGRAVAVLVIGVVAVRLAKEWLHRTLLPTTRMNSAMREYTTSLFGYAGYVLAAVLALSAIGVAVGRIGWIVSALAVGIGFGLQSIVQNFISGLILLTEGKIRVGDWVVLGGDVEGDVRRIDVRATEIQRSDRSTIIVPNSEFITKVVRNVTFANSLGLVQIKLPVPRSMDVARVRALILDAFEASGDILRTPAPTVTLESVDPVNATFSAIGFTSSPRSALATRSAVLFDLLERLNAAVTEPKPSGA